MKLYALPGACSFVPHTALEWTGENYEIEVLTHAQVKSEEYKRINPQGSVPAIVNGGATVTQNLSVQTYIDAVYPQANIFGVENTPAGRAKIMYWLAFLNSDIHKGFAPLFNPDGFVDGEKAQESLIKHAHKKLVNMLSTPNEQLGKQDYLTGKKSTADIYLYVILRWSKEFGLVLSKYHNFNPFIKRIEDDKGVISALAQEGLEKIGSL